MLKIVLWENIAILYGPIVSCSAILVKSKTLQHCNKPYASHVNHGEQQRNKVRKAVTYMNNQEMQFADPEWRPPQQGSINADPREQEAYVPQPINTDPRQWQTTPPQEEERGYRETPFYAGPGAEKIGTSQSRQQPRRR